MTDKQIKKILRERFSHCLKSDTFPALIAPEIPEKQQMSAHKAFVPADEKILGLCDTSIFGRGKNGLAFTDKGVCFKDLMNATHIRHYDEDWEPGTDTAFDALGIKPDNTFFDTFAVTALMDALVTAYFENEQGE